LSKREKDATAISSVSLRGVAKIQMQE